jgi:hypothetical protein
VAAMTGRKKIEAALSSKGSKSIPVVIPYESVMIRDHWEQLVSDPWWHLYSPDLEVQLRWRRAVLDRIENDFLEVPDFYTRKERDVLSIQQRDTGIFLVDRGSGEAKRLEREPIGGVMITNLKQTTGLEAKAVEDIDLLVPPLKETDSEAFLRSGAADLAAGLIEEYREVRLPIDSVHSPLWACDKLWGFEPLMLNIATAPDLVHYACRRYLDYALRTVRHAAAMGVGGIWIEECLTDQVSPTAYASLNLPYLQQLVEEIHTAGMSSLLYFCGDPTGKLELILESGCDAVGFEESKKDFSIDIEHLVGRINGRCALLGNIDAIEIVERGSDEQLQSELSRQIRAGRSNGGRFITSIGSPVTPETPSERIRSYLHLARELGAAVSVD